MPLTIINRDEFTLNQKVTEMPLFKLYAWQRTGVLLSNRNMIAYVCSQKKGNKLKTKPLTKTQKERNIESNDFTAGGCSDRNSDY